MPNAAELRSRHFTFPGSRPYYLFTQKDRRRDNHLSATKKKRNDLARKDDGYPFDTGDWAKWTNVKRLNWLRNFRDKLRDKYKTTFGVTDEQIAEMDADVAAMEKIVEVEQSNPERAAGFKDKPPEEKLVLMRDYIDTVSANDFEKARLVGWTPVQVEDMRAAWDDWERQVAEAERIKKAKRAAGFLPGETTADLIRRRLGYDDTALREAFERHDEATVDREFDKWIGQCKILVMQDMAFAKWFAEYTKDQTNQLLWSDVIGDDGE
jgi:hypothetical protein